MPVSTLFLKQCPPAPIVDCHMAIFSSKSNTTERNGFIVGINALVSLTEGRIYNELFWSKAGKGPVNGDNLSHSVWSPCFALMALGSLLKECCKIVNEICTYLSVSHAD